MGMNAQPSPSPLTTAASPESEPQALRLDYRQYIQAIQQIPDGVARAIVAGVMNAIGVKLKSTGIHPSRLAKFLEALAGAKPAELRRTVSQGLEALGITTTSARKRGRPKGTTKKDYAKTYQQYEPHMTFVWQRKSELQRMGRRRWDVELRAELAYLQPQVCDALLEAKTKHQFIAKLVAAQFNVDLAVAERSIRRARESHK
jgi:hypothetical protein